MSTAASRIAPYGQIVDCLKNDRLVWVLGAGASSYTRSSRLKWKPDSEHLPLGSELSSEIAAYFGIPAKTQKELGLAGVCSLIAHQRKNLDALLRRFFTNCGEPTPLHELIAVCDGQLIITTNYDNLLERAFQLRGKPYFVVVYTGDSKAAEPGQTICVVDEKGTCTYAIPEELRLARENGTFQLRHIHTEWTGSLIFKIHGSSDGPCTFCISDEDQETLLLDLSRGRVIPLAFYPHFYARHFLFVGYGLADWSCRLLFSLLRGQQRLRGFRQRTPHWAVRKPSKLGRLVDSDLWKGRGLEMIDLDLTVFTNGLKCAIGEATK